MWKKLKFLCLIDAEIKLHLKVAVKNGHDTNALHQVGIDYSWIKIIYPSHNSIYRIFLRRFGSIKKTPIEGEMDTKLQKQADKLLENLSPTYIKKESVSSQNSVRDHVILTLEGERFITPLGYFSALLKEYGALVSFVFGLIGLGIIKILIYCWHLATKSL